MRIVEIPKTRGRTRTIYVPDRDEMASLRALVGEIADKARKADRQGVQHGFVRRRSPVTNAQAHVGHRYTITMDLRDFFASVTPEKLRGRLPREIIDAIVVDGATRQGLPTSPSAANLAAVPMDEAIRKWAEKANKQIVYTRYADDLSVSYDDPALTPILLAQIPQIVRRCGFSIATEKTHVWDARMGRRIITGVAVDDTGVHPTRDAKRRLRAARHQGRTDQSRGLAEWCAMKPPQQRSVGLIDENMSLIDQVNRVSRSWKLGQVWADKMPDKGPNEDLGEDCITTGDPVYMLGMSTYTTGWRSCTRQPDGQYRRGTVFFAHLRGTRIAAYLATKTGCHGGVERRLMRARCLVHTLRNGVKLYDRRYGDQQSIDHLTARLRAAGYISMDEAKKKHHSQKVEGHAPAKWKAWFDGLRSATAKASTGRWAGKQVRVCMI